MTVCSQLLDGAEFLVSVFDSQLTQTANSGSRMSYGNKHEIKDGRIVLYTRDGSAIYHARISVEGVRGYIVKSTKQRALDKAREVAENLYDDLRYKVRHGEEIGVHTFRTI